MQVAVIVLNWQRYEQTRACLASLEGISSRHHIYLVDNESNGRLLEALVQRFPRVIPCPLERNEGFAGGANVGMRKAMEEGADYLLLLNNDARATPDLIETLLQTFDKFPDAGIVCPAIRNQLPDGRIQSLGINFNPWTGDIRLRRERPANRPQSPQPLSSCEAASLRGFGSSADEAAPPQPFDVDAAPGTAMLINRQLIENIGFFDLRYYFYFEDLDYCFRTRAAGYKVLLEPRATLFHTGGATIGRSPDKLYYALRNQLFFANKYGAPLPSSLNRLREVYLQGRYLLHSVGKSRPVSRIAALRQAIKDHRAGRGGARGGRR